MQAALKQIGRIWVAIFIAYALMFQSMAAGSAAGLAIPSGVLCVDGKLAGTGDAPAGHASHGDLCCILCQAPSPAMSVTDVDAKPAFRAAPLPVSFAPLVATPRLHAGLASPLQPRAPPVRI